MIDVLRATLFAGGQQSTDSPSTAVGDPTQSRQDFGKIFGETASPAQRSTSASLEDLVEVTSEKLKTALEQARFDFEGMSASAEAPAADSADRKPENRQPTASENNVNMMNLVSDGFSVLFLSQLSPSNPLQRSAPVDEKQSRIVLTEATRGIGSIDAYAGEKAQAAHAVNELISRPDDRSEISMNALLKIPDATPSDEAGINDRPILPKVEPEKTLSRVVSASTEATAKAAEAFTPVKIHVSEISTHFPVIIADALPARSFQNFESLEDRKVLGAQAVTQLADPPSDHSDRLRVIRFQLEPAELGGLMVKMRVRETGVEISIEAKSALTTNLLTDARDALSSAIQHKGMTLQVFDVTTQTEPAHSRNAQGEGFGSSNSAWNTKEHMDQGGFFSDGRPPRDQRREGSFREEICRKDDDAVSFDVAAGVIL
jgi:flagellar hook-length control protein FliK